MRTGDIAAVGGESQLARAAQVRQIHKAAQHVQARIHGPHAEHSAADADDILARRHGGGGVDVFEKLHEVHHTLLLLAIRAHRLLVVLLHVRESVGEVVQRPLPAVEHSRGGWQFLDLLGDRLGGGAAADLLVAARDDSLSLPGVTHDFLSACNWSWRSDCWRSLLQALSLSR